MLFYILFSPLNSAGPCHTTADAQSSSAPFAGQGKQNKPELLGTSPHPQIQGAAPQHSLGHRVAKLSRPSPHRPHITVTMAPYVTPANHEGPIRFLDPISSSCDLCASLRTYGYAELSLSFKCPRVAQAEWEEGPFVLGFFESLYDDGRGTFYIIHQLANKLATFITFLW